MKHQLGKSRCPHHEGHKGMRVLGQRGLDCMRVQGVQGYKGR